MQLSPWHFDHKPWYGWSISTVIHLSLVIAVSLLLMPSGDGTSELLEVEITFEDIGADLVALESFTAELDSLEDDVAHDDDSASIFEETDPLEISSPLETLAIENADGTGGDDTGEYVSGAGGRHAWRTSPHEGGRGAPNDRTGRLRHDDRTVSLSARGGGRGQVARDLGDVAVQQARELAGVWGEDQR